MTISVVVPIYNVAAYLKECVDMVLCQTYNNLEVILVDDGSTDESGKICDEYAKRDNRVIVIHKANGGLSDARNAGTKVATGVYILYLDSDDKWATVDFIENLVCKASESKADLILFGSQKWSGDKDVYIEHLQYDSSLFNEQESAKVLDNLLKTNQFNVSAWSKFVKTDILKSNDIQFEKSLLNEDFDWTFKMWPNLRKISFCNNSIYLYRMREGSITKTFRYKNAADYCWIVEHWMNYWLNSNDVNRDIYLGYVANIYVTIVYFYYILNDKDRKQLKSLILKLSEVLDYSRFFKSKRLKLIRNVFGSRVMLFVGGIIGYLRKY